MPFETAAFRCPTKDDVLATLIALLPRGRAWQTHEGGPQPGAEQAFNPDAFNPDAFAVRSVAPSIMRLFWQSVAETFFAVTARLCDLRREFWCASQQETNDLWMQEYGLPEACDPFPDLCTKVAALGGTRCDYYQLIAARAGWSISCIEVPNTCGSRAGCAKAGFARPGGPRAGFLAILVDLDLSTAWTGGSRRRPQAGRMKAGQRLACGPDLGPLDCLLARVVHAEIKLLYEVN
jgi:hypothetical protein